MSAYRARLSGGYPRIEKLIRGAKSLKALQDLWDREMPTIVQWPDEWQAFIIAEKDQRKTLLSKGSTEKMLADSLRQLEARS